MSMNFLEIRAYLVGKDIIARLSPFAALINTTLFQVHSPSSLRNCKHRKKDVLMCLRLKLLKKEIWF